jgi:ribonuclease BN (tRNA processing enzyme)
VKWTVLGCHSPYPGPGSATPGYLLETKGKKLLVDCGSGVLSQLAKITELHVLDAVLLSHLHHDHIADFFILQYAVQTAIKTGKRQRPLTVLAPQYPEKWGRLLAYHQAIDLHPIQEGDPLYLCGLAISFFQTDHKVPCFAMRFDNGAARILYGADAGPQTKWDKMGTNPELFICESTFLEKDMPHSPMGHLSARQAAIAGESLGAKRLLLTHLYPEYNPNRLYDEARPHFSGELTVARIGLVIDVGEA